MILMYFVLAWAGLTAAVSFFVHKYGSGTFSPGEIVELVAVLVFFWLMPVVVVSKLVLMVM
jgi:hypothetical protein